MKDSMMHKKYTYISQIGEKKILDKESWFSEISFGLYEQKPKVDSSPWSTIHKPDTLTTGLWLYTTKLIHWYKQFNNT